MSGLVYKNVLSLSCVLLMTACSSTAVVRPPESLYTTNFTEPLSYQDSAFLKLPKFP